MVRSTHPIIFSDPMLRAILDGRKMQTRRVLKSQQAATSWWQEGMADGGIAWFCDLPHGFGEKSLMSPPYRVGDLLWVREAFTMSSEGRAVYRADSSDETAAEVKWSSPIYMPRCLSRLTLEVMGVRVQRVQEITPDDARAEGHPVSPLPFQQEVHDEAAREWFMDRWDELNKERGFAWASNPWVVAVTFLPHQKNIDSLICDASDLAPPETEPAGIGA